MREEFFEQIGAVDLQIEALQFAQTAVLPVGEIPGILQPDEPRLVHQHLLRGALLADLVAADLANRLHEMTDDVEFVEHQDRLGRPDRDHIDVRLPLLASLGCDDTVIIQRPLRAA
jgi:hypothetical protein